MQEFEQEYIEQLKELKGELVKKREEFEKIEEKLAKDLRTKSEECKRREEKIENLEKEIGQRNGTIQAKNEQLEAKAEECKSLLEEVRKIGEGSKKYIEENHRKNEECGRLADEVRRLGLENHELHQQIKTLRKSIEDMTKEFASSQQETDSIMHRYIIGGIKQKKTLKKNAGKLFSAKDQASKLREDCEYIKKWVKVMQGTSAKLIQGCIEITNQQRTEAKFFYSEHERHKRETRRVFDELMDTKHYQQIRIEHEVVSKDQKELQEKFEVLSQKTDELWKALKQSQEDGMPLGPPPPRSLS